MEVTTQDQELLRQLLYLIGPPWFDKFFIKIEIHFEDLAVARTIVYQ